MKWPWQRDEGRDFVDAEVIAQRQLPPSNGLDYYQLPVAAGGGADDSQAIRGMFGSDGLSWYQDLISGGPDVNPELMGRKKYEVYDEMRKSDPTVRSVLWMYKLPIRAADWSVEPASDDPVDELIAEAIAWQFGLEDYEGDGRLDLTWDDSLQQALAFLDFGAMFEEIVWGDPEIFTDADGDEHLIRPIARLAPRFPVTIMRVLTDPRSGELAWVEQDLPFTRPIPGGKMVHYALEKEGTNWWGTSLLRPMYGPWRLKKALQIAAAIGWDRFAAGVPIVRYPKSGGDAARRRAEEIGRGYRANERGYIALEGPAPAQSQPDPNTWSVEILNGSASLADPTELIRLYDEQIATGGVQQASRLGMTNHGSRAVGDVLQDTGYLAVQAVARHIAEVRARRVFRRFVDVNFGTQFDLPRLNVSKIQARNIPTLAAAISDLSAAGLTFTDPDTQNDIRDQLDLRHLPDATQAALEGLPPEVGVTPVPTPTPAVDPPAGGTPDEVVVGPGGPTAS